MLLELTIRHRHGAFATTGPATQRAALPDLRSLAAGFVASQSAEIEIMAELLVKARPS